MASLQGGNGLPTLSVLFLFLLASQLELCLCQSCDLDTCNTACISWGVADSFCQNDYQPWDSKISCQCEYPYQSISSSDKAASLNQCVACNVANVGPQALSYYQIWTVICDEYAVNGEQAAVSVAMLPEAEIVQAFSTGLLPAISSTYCGAAVVITSTSTSQISTTSSTSSSVSTSPVAVSTSTTHIVSTSLPTSSAKSTTDTSSTSSTGQSSSSVPASNQAARVGTGIPRVMTTTCLAKYIAVISVGAGLLAIIL